MRADPIYLDYNATTPLHPAVVAAMRPYLETHFGNPSSSHVYGRRAREAVEQARQQVAALLGARPSEIVFTSGGSESNNHAILGVARAERERGRHVITSAVEHPAVSEVCGYLEADGFRVTRVGVDGTGRVDPAAVEAAIAPDTVLITIMHANNEVGTIQPIAEIAAMARKHGVRLHTDAAQSVGKIPVQVDALGVDLLSVAGHKLYGPKGVGALFVRDGVQLEKLIFGAGHEGGRRAGTENVAAIVGLGEACARAEAELPQRVQHSRAMRDRLHEGVAARIAGVCLNGHPEQRLPNTVSLRFPGVRSTELLARMPAVAASAGAACHADGVHLSSTLAAMRLSPDVAAGTVRFSTGMFLTESDVERAVGAVVDAWNTIHRV